VIGRLTGRVIDDGADGLIAIDVRGVGYEVMTPLGALGRLSTDAAGDVTLFIHTHVREDALLLYGFATSDDRAAFRALIGVSSIGPKLAVGVLGALSAGELAAVVARKEPAKLTKIPGIGKRTAERLILELEGKLAVAPSPPGAKPIAPTASAGPKVEVLRGMLTNLGFRSAEADRAVLALADRVEAEPLSDLVRAALGLLAR
jgi:Holliday junction DNA helicase RuvA